MSINEFDPLNKEKEFFKKIISPLIENLEPKDLVKLFSALISLGKTNLNDPKLFNLNENIDFKENCFIIKGETPMTLTYFFEINPYKKIYLSFYAKSYDKCDFHLYAGFQTFDKKFEHIDSLFTNIKKSSLTYLIEPLESGMNIIKVQNVINFETGKITISYHARSDLKDLPNRNIINLDIESINYEKNEIILSSPINIPNDEIIPIGTGIRIHTSTSTYNYCSHRGPITNEWVQYEGFVKGLDRKSVV